MNSSATTKDDGHGAASAWQHEKPGAQSTPMLELRSIEKSFGAVRALRDVSLKLYSGRVTGLVGDNGAGKSTLVKIMTGVHSLDAGEIFVDGKAMHFSSPKDAVDAGIATVFQDLAV